MIQPPDLTRLSHAEKDTLIRALLAQLAGAHERIAGQDLRIATLEARLGELTRPPKTPDNSSKPPSQGQKQNRRRVRPVHGAKAALASVGPCIPTLTA